MTQWTALTINLLVPWVCFFGSGIAEAKVLEKIEAVVNGDIVTLSEINDYQHKLANGGFLNDLLFSDPEVIQKASKDKDYLLKLLMDEKIIDYEVKQNGFLVTDERVNKEIATIAKRQSMTVPQMQETLRHQGVDFDEYRNFVKKSIERRQLVEKEITSKIKISEQDIISHYLANNKASQSQVFEFNISHILFKPSDQAKADSALTQLAQGANFEKLVGEMSDDADTRKQAGRFGTFKSGEMIASIQQAIEGLKIGQTSKVVKTPMGLHIFKVNDKKLVEDPEIEKQKAQIYQQLFSQAFKEQLEFWLVHKRKDAIIQVNKS